MKQLFLIFRPGALAAILFVAGCQTSGPKESPMPEGRAGAKESGLTLDGSGAGGHVSDDSDAKTTVSFVDEIKPILEDRCVMCHNRAVLAKRPSFENRKLAFKGDAAGPIIVPGDAEGSRLVVAISAPDFHDLAMPPVSHRISKDEIALIRLWIDEGADWPEGAEGELKSDKRPAE